VAKDKMKKLLFVIFVFITVIAFIFYLNSGVKNNGPVDNRLQVSASFYPLYFFASQIGGDKVNVVNITPAGVEPHDYDPSAQDIAAIESGGMLILNGSLEAWGDKIKDTLQGSRVLTIIAGRGLFTQKISDQGVSQVDPHVWLDPLKAKQEAHTIADGFIKIDPKNEKYYKNNELLLDAEFDRLDSEYKNGLAQCPQRDIITSHAAFGYLATRYGLTQISIAGLSPDAEPSAQQLADITIFARQHNIEYIFFESLVSPKLSQTIASEVGAYTLVLDPIEGVSDNNIKAGNNYFTIMEDNLKNLQKALCHSAPIQSGLR
jgi:zinc transport system substrate-binding protein